METRTKNRIGLIGLAVLFLAIGTYAFITYWPPRDPEILRNEISTIPPENFKNQVAVLELDKLNYGQLDRLSHNFKTYFDNLPDDQRRAMREGGDRYRRNVDELLMTVKFIDYLRATPETKQGIALSAAREMDAAIAAWKKQAATQPGVRPDISQTLKRAADRLMNSNPQLAGANREFMSAVNAARQ